MMDILLLGRTSDRNKIIITIVAIFFNIYVFADMREGPYRKFVHYSSL